MVLFTREKLDTIHIVTFESDIHVERCLVVPFFSLANMKIELENEMTPGRTIDC